jgi:PST family polysaccharide transporter/lipopolysaccharide exporter
MFVFSKWTTLYGFLDFVLETADNAVVGTLIGTTALAFYRLAYQIASEGSSALVIVLTPVAFPAVSRIQSDVARVRQGFRAMLGLASAALIPLTALLIVLGPVGVPLLLGDRWAPAVGPLTILAFGALLRGTIETARPVLLGLGRSKDDLGLKLFQVLILLALLIPAAMNYGTPGVAWSVVVAAACTLPVWVGLLRRASGATVRDFVEPLVAPVICGLLAVLSLAALPVSQAGWLGLSLAASVYCATYVGLSALLSYRLPRSGFALLRSGAR